MDDCRFDFYIDFLRQKIENFQHDGMNEEEKTYRSGLLLALADAEIIRDATPEWIAGVFDGVR